MQRVVEHAARRLVAQPWHGLCVLNLKEIKANSHFSNYNQYPTDITSFRNQLVFRSSNLGMLELDYLIGNWAKKYMKTLDYLQLIQYDREILGMETPDLFKILIQAQSDAKLQEEYKQVVADSHFLQELIKYGITGEAAEHIHEE